MPVNAAIGRPYFSLSATYQHASSFLQYSMHEALRTYSIIIKGLAHLMVGR